VIGIVIAMVIGLVAGFLISRRPAPPPRRPTARPVKLGSTAQTARPLADVIEAMRAEALQVESRADGFALVDQLVSEGAVADRLNVRVSDPSAVTIATLSCGDTSSLDLPFQLALALVPLYGPLTLVIETGAYEIDGSKDRHALVRELSRRQTERMREALARVRARAGQ